MKVKRFYYVSSARSTTLHRAVSRSDGLTSCGRAVTTQWSWTLKPSHKIRRCKACQKAA